jgi:hypothetical protein
MRDPQGAQTQCNSTRARERGRSYANDEEREGYAPSENGSLERFANAIRATAEIAPQAQS